MTHPHDTPLGEPTLKSLLSSLGRLAHTATPVQVMNIHKLEIMTAPGFMDDIPDDHIDAVGRELDAIGISITTYSLACALAGVLLNCRMITVQQIVEETVKLNTGITDPEAEPKFLEDITEAIEAYAPKWMAMTRKLVADELE